MAASSGPEGSGRFRTWHSTPVRAAARVIDRTYHSAASSLVGTTTASVGSTARARRAAVLAVTSWVMAAAMARPSMRLTR